MVNAEQLVIDNAFNNVKRAKADQNCPYQQFCGPIWVLPVSVTPKNEQGR